MTAYSWFSCLPIAGLLLVASCTSSLSPKDIDRQGRDTVVLITYQDQLGFGTGFLVRHGGIGCAVLTASHMVAPSPDRLNITVAQDAVLSQDLRVTQAENYYVASIRFQRAGNHCPYQGLSLDVTQDMAAGDPVWLLGYPERTGNNTELLLKALNGKVTTVELPNERGLSLAYDITSGAGMSGSPELNKRGQVVAIHSQADRNRQSSEYVTWGVDIQLAFSALSLKLPVNSWPKILGRSFLWILGVCGTIVLGQILLKLIGRNWQAYQNSQERRQQPQQKRGTQKQLKNQQKSTCDPLSKSIINEPLTLTLTPKGRGQTVPLELLPILGGTFWMGQTAAEATQLKKELGEHTYHKLCAEDLPRHRVTVPAFWMGCYPITQAQYQAVMGRNPATQYDSKFVSPNQPVVGVSWDMAVQFCETLTKKLEGYLIRLPTEAEWEYACRAGTETAFSFGDRLEPHQGNFDGNYTYSGSQKGVYRHVTTPIGTFPANAWGLQDMHGNVWEWCADEYYNSYQQKPKTLTENGSIAWTENLSVVSPLSNQTRVLRGGSWYNVPWVCRSAQRIRNDRSSALSIIGFRVICLARTSWGQNS